MGADETHGTPDSSFTTDWNDTGTKESKLSLVRDRRSGETYMMDPSCTTDCQYRELLCRTVLEALKSMKAMAMKCFVELMEDNILRKKSSVTTVAVSISHNLTANAICKTAVRDWLNRLLEWRWVCVAWPRCAWVVGRKLRWSHPRTVGWGKKASKTELRLEWTLDSLCVVARRVRLIGWLWENPAWTEIAISLAKNLLEMRASAIRPLHSSTTSVVSVLEHVVVLRICWGLIASIKTFRACWDIKDAPNVQ